MKQKLSQNLVLALKADAGKTIIVYDSHQNAPIGFGVRVSGTGRKVYILQKRVGGRVFKHTLGPIGAFASIDDAREAARQKAAEMLEKKKSPKRVKIEEKARDDAWTIGEIWRRYIEYLDHRRDKPIKPATMRVIGTARRKLDDWNSRTLSSFKPSEIVKRFDTGIGPKTRKAPEGQGRTMMEQTFRWLNAAVEYCIAREQQDAAADNRGAAITSNPFKVLKTEGRFRSGRVLEADYKKRGSRNPMSKEEGTLQKYLAEIFRLRSGSAQKRQQADYMYITLMLAGRMNETAALRWRDRAERPELCNWADTKTRKVYFYDTKNGTDHTMPMPEGVYSVLMRRKEDRGKSEWIFPVRSTKRTVRAEHYADIKGLFKYLRKRLGFMLRSHDLRRTFGRFADEIVSGSLVNYYLNHRDTRNTTTRYTEAEWHRIASELQRIECSILSACPDLYNALLPPTYPRIA